MDPRAVAYCNGQYKETFNSVVAGSLIWIPDPYDVEIIHQDAREQFRKLLNRASTPQMQESGKTLLIIGEGGSGKTHLLRSFWATTHEHYAGFCGYARYVLAKLIESLEHPYRYGTGETGLKRLAKGALDAIDNCPEDLKDQLLNDLLEPEEVEKLVYRIAYLAVQLDQFKNIDINVIRAILFTLANDTRIHSVILQWLRAEDLPPRDRELIGRLVPRNQPEMAVKTIQDLGRLMHAVSSGAFVLLVDEMDAVLDHGKNDDEVGYVFRSAINTLIDISESVPNSILVINCLDHLFGQLKPKAHQTKLDRLLNDPEPIPLEASLTVPQIDQVVRIRLKELYISAGFDEESANTTFPFTHEDFHKLDRMRTRDILQSLQKHRASCIQAGRLLPFEPTGPAIVPPATTTSRLGKFSCLLPE